MFAKLLKYDLQSILKHWWIAAVVSACVAFAGGICISIANVNYTSYSVLQDIAQLGIVVCCIGLAIFYVLSEILVFMRFYKNFYTDEGYLTFTLPVKKSQLLNSKTLMSLIVYVATALVLAFDVVLMFSVGIGDEIFKDYIIRDILRTIREIIDIVGLYIPVYMIEAVILFVALRVLSALSIFICLTISAVIVRKHRVLAAIGIYYLLGGAVTGFVQTVLLRYNFYRVFERLSELEKPQVLCSVMLIGFLVIGVAVAVSTALYMAQNWLLDKKLNLE